MAKTKGLVSVRIDKSRLEGLGPLLSIGPKGVSWAMAEAMTAAGAGAVDRARGLLQEEVDRPTGWTLRSLTSLPRRVVPAGGLRQYVGFKGQGGQDHYLWPLIKGGRRRLKASERIGGVGYIIPLNKAPMRLNRHGNWTGGQYRRLLGQLRAYKGTARILNASGSLSSRKNRRRVGLFLSKDGRFVMGRSGSRGSVQRVALLRKESPVYRKQLTLLEKLPEMYMKAFWSRLYKELLERNLRKRV